MKASTLGLMLIAIAVVAIVVGQWRSGAEPPAHPVPTAGTPAR